MKLTNIGTVAVPTADQDRAIAFYVDVLGLSVRVDAPFGNGQRWVEVAAGDAETTIALPPSLPNTPTGIDTGIRLRTADAEADHRVPGRAGCGRRRRHALARRTPHVLPARPRQEHPLRRGERLIPLAAIMKSTPG